MRTVHRQLGTTNNFLVPQQLYKNTDRFGLLNPQTAQAPRSFGCKDSQKSFSREPSLHFPQG